MNFMLLVLLFTNSLSKPCVPNCRNGHREEKNGMDPIASLHTSPFKA